MPFRLSSYLLVIACLAGCTQTTHHGDATIIDRSDAIFVHWDSLRLPKIDLSEAGHHKWEVRDLPVSVVPTELVVHTAERESQAIQSNWKNATVHVKVVGLEGSVITQGTAKLSEWNRGASYRDDGWEVVFPDLFGDQVPGYHSSMVPEGLPRSYNVHLTVKSPSRAADQAYLHGLFKLEASRKHQRLMRESFPE